MPHIVLIGAGQIGSRHLQSLAALSGEYTISVVEPYAVSMDTAKCRWQEVTTALSPQVSWYEDITHVNAGADVIIIATGAKGRLKLIEQVKAQFQFSYLILEKVLFQSVSELELAAKMLSDDVVYVNCPRRTYPFYRRLEQLLKTEAKVSYSITGQNWDMACNAIHHIDLWFYLAGLNDYRCDVSLLAPAIIPSKRAGCYEVAGTITGHADNGSEFRFTCLVDEPERYYSSVISTNNWRVNINEPKRTYELTDLTSGESEHGILQVNMQSHLTAEIVKALLETGCCELTLFDESAAIHYPFLRALEGFFKQQEPGFDFCPIT